MAIIATEMSGAVVEAHGEEMKATGVFNAQMLEMMATTYSYIMMSSAREALQNACDAARAAGKSFKDGVVVTLPTIQDPMLVVRDFGRGMTLKFMKSDYLVMGVSTKAGSDKAAGGMGVGRWAAYGYNRECYIATCHEEDKVRTTFFQYQGEDGGPSVRVAASTPSTDYGTTVSFPVKTQDLEEMYQAIGYIREIMLLTMGDTFSVTNESLLPARVIPELGVTLDLGEYSSRMEGIKVHLMQGGSLRYGKTLSRGSVVVLKNPEVLVGGFAFNVTADGDVNSLFNSGAIVEVPMHHRLQFMASREELKHTDALLSLMAGIDLATRFVLLNKLKSLTETLSIDNLITIQKILSVQGNEASHCFQLPNDVRTTAKELALGIDANFTYSKDVPLVDPHGFARRRAVRVLKAGSSTFSYALPGYRSFFKDVLTQRISKDVSLPYTFEAANLDSHPVLVVNDVKARGVERFRHWSRENKSALCVFFVGEESLSSEEAAKLFNQAYAGTLKVVRTSEMADVAKREARERAKKSSVKVSTGLQYFCRANNKLESEALSVVSFDKAGENRVYLVRRAGSGFEGFKPELTLQELKEGSSYNSLQHTMDALGITRLYLLTPKQFKEFEDAKTEHMDSGAWLEDFEVLAEEDESLAMEVAALKSWVTLEEACSERLSKSDVKDLLDGNPLNIYDSQPMRNLFRALALAPRLELVGTRFDKAVTGLFDALTGEILMRNYRTPAPEEAPLRYFLDFTKNLLPFIEDERHTNPEIKKLMEGVTTAYQASNLNYGDTYKSLQDQFPLLKVTSVNVMSDSAAIGALTQALTIR